MKIVRAEKLEDCFDGSMVFGYAFDSAWTRNSIHALKPLGTLEYFADFPKPFFRLRGPGGLEIKGVEGEDTCRVIFPRSNTQEAKKSFEAHFGR